MSKKFATLFGLMLVVSITTACGSSPASTVQATPISPAPFQGNVTIEYAYDGVPEEWLSRLPETTNVEVTFNEEDGWSYIDFDLEDYANVSMFDFSVYEPDYDGEIRYGGCLLYGKQFDDCTSVAPSTTLPASVVMSNCKQAYGGLYCQRSNLTVIITENYISFSAEEAFQPQYREWLREILQYQGGGELPDVLEPGVNYLVSTP